MAYRNLTSKKKIINERYIPFNGTHCCRSIATAHTHLIYIIKIIMFKFGGYATLLLEEMKNLSLIDLSLSVDVGLYQRMLIDNNNLGTRNNV